MGKHKGGSLRQRLHRGRIKTKLHWERTFHTGANMPAVRSIRQLIHKILGLLIGVLQTAWRLVTLLAVMVGEALHKGLGKHVSQAAERCHRAAEWLEEKRAQHLLEGGAKKRNRVPACAFLGTATILLFSISYFGIGVEVMLDGKSIGFVESKQEMEDIIAKVEKRTSGYLGRPYNLSVDLTYSLGYASPESRLDPEATEELLFSKVEEVSTQYVLSVDGTPVGANPSKTALELLQQRILSTYVSGDENATAEFVQDVTIEQMTVPTSYVQSISELEETLKGERQATQTYSVQQGDTLSEIAENNGMTLAQIQGLNPQVDPARIQIGQTITLAGSEPMLSVKKTTTEEYTREIGYETEIQYDDTMLNTESKIVTPGQNGVAQVVAKVVSIDGVEQERTVQSWEVVQEPQNEVKVIGTKEPPAKAAKGYFIQPFHGILTSRFGTRSRGYHTGVDWAGAKGSAVVAADGGTVIQAGWNGGYGYCVTIDHGNGLQTLYAHNSALLVKVGQKVAQGEQIAKLGSTGNSTGPHCHWEVRVNGTPVNPLAYLG